MLRNSLFSTAFIGKDKDTRFQVGCSCMSGMSLLRLGHPDALLSSCLVPDYAH